MPRMTSVIGHQSSSDRDDWPKKAQALAGGAWCLAPSSSSHPILILPGPWHLVARHTEKAQESSASCPLRSGHLIKSDHSRDFEVLVYQLLSDIFTIPLRISVYISCCKFVIFTRISVWVIQSIMIASAAYSPFLKSQENSTSTGSLLNSIPG